MTPRVVGLLRDLEDAAAWVGEQGEYRPVVTFFSSVSFKGSEALELAFALHKSLLSSKFISAHSLKYLQLLTLDRH